MAHTRKHSGLGPWLPGSVHCDLDGLVVGGHQVGVGVDRNGDGEALAAAGAAHEAEVAELGHLVLHDGRVVAELPAVVVVIAGSAWKRKKKRKKGGKLNSERIFHNFKGAKSRDRFHVI